MKLVSKAQVKVAKDIFVKGFVAQVTDETTMMVSAISGIGQGLKYKGNFKNGLISGVVVAGVLGTVGGVNSLIRNSNVIKRAL